MAEASRRVRHDSLPAAVLTLGAAQSVLVALALSRFLDPGWTTFGPVGVLSGLGMAGLALLAVRNLRWRRDVYRRLAWVGVLAGVLTAVVWASLLGGPFYMNDLPRVAIVVVSDCLFAIALVSAARMADPAGAALPGVGTVAALMSLRALIELFLVALVVMETGRGSGPDVPLLVLAVSVLIGWLILAAWEIGVGARLLLRREADEAISHAQV